MRTRVPPVAALALALALTSAACGRSAGPTRSAEATAPVRPAAATASPSDHGSHGSTAAGPETTPEPVSTPALASGPEGAAYLALCEMRALVAAGDLDRAEATFHDEVHEALHELAEELEGTDREAAAALLVAKAKVEADLGREPLDAAALGPDVRALQRAMAAALEAAAITPPPCGEEAQG